MPMVSIVSGMHRGRESSSQVKPKADRIVSRKAWKARSRTLEVSHGYALRSEDEPP